MAEKDNKQEPQAPQAPPTGGFGQGGAVAPWHEQEETAEPEKPKDNK